MGGLKWKNEVITFIEPLPSHRYLINPLPLFLFNLHTHKKGFSDISIQTSPGARRHRRICGDDKVLQSFVSTERVSWGLPHRLKKAMLSAGTMQRNYHMNMTTAPWPLKTINLPTRAPRCQITPRISPLNLNFSGCIKSWMLQRGGEKRGSREGGKGFVLDRRMLPLFYVHPPPQPETCYNAINLVL